MNRFKAALAKFIPGDPADPKTTLAPLCTEGALTKVESQIDSALKGGATVLLGGKRVDRQGYFLEPTILSNVRPEKRSAPGGRTPAPASPPRGPGNGILRAETGGLFQAQNAGEQSEFGSQTTLRLTNPPELRGFLSTRKPPRFVGTAWWGMQESN